MLPGVVTEPVKLPSDARGEEIVIPGTCRRLCFALDSFTGWDTYGDLVGGHSALASETVDLAEERAA